MKREIRSSRLSFLAAVFLVIILLSGCSGGGGGTGALPDAQPTAAFISPPPIPPEPIPLKSTSPPSKAAIINKGDFNQSLGYTLAAGWNAISFPFDSVTSTSGFTHYLYYWEGEYKTVDPVAHPESIDCRKGYFAYAASATIVYADGNYTGTINSVPLNQGWNFIGQPLRDTKIFSEVVISYDGMMKTLARAASTMVPTDGAWLYSFCYSYTGGAWQQGRCEHGNKQAAPQTAEWFYSWVNGASLDMAPFPSGPRPNIISVTPSSEAPGNQVAISGTGFGASQGDTDTVTFYGGDAGIVAYWSDTSITCDVPSRPSGFPEGLPPGEVTVVVTSKGLASNPYNFHINDVSAPYAVSSDIPRYGAIQTSTLNGPFTVNWNKAMNDACGAVSIYNNGFKSGIPIPNNLAWSPDKKTLTVNLDEPIPEGCKIGFTFSEFQDSFGNLHTGKRPDVDYSNIPSTGLPVSVACDAVSIDPGNDRLLMPGELPQLHFETTSQGSSSLLIAANFRQIATTSSDIPEGGPASTKPQPNNYNELDKHNRLGLGSLGGASNEADTINVAWDGIPAARYYNIYEELNTGGFMNGLPLKIINHVSSLETTAQVTLPEIENVINEYNVGRPLEKRLPTITAANGTLLYFDNGFSQLQMAVTAVNTEGLEGGYSNPVGIKDNVAPVVADNGIGFDDPVTGRCDVPSSIGAGVPYVPADTYSPCLALFNSGNLDIVERLDPGHNTGIGRGYYTLTDWGVIDRSGSLLVPMNEDLDSAQTLPSLILSTSGASEITSASISGAGNSRRNIQVVLSDVTALATGDTISCAGVRDEAGNAAPNNYTAYLRLVDRMGPFLTSGAVETSGASNDKLTIIFQESVDAASGGLAGNYRYHITGGAQPTGTFQTFGAFTCNLSPDGKTATLTGPAGSFDSFETTANAGGPHIPGNAYARTLIDAKDVQDLSGNTLFALPFMIGDFVGPMIYDKTDPIPASLGVSQGGVWNVLTSPTEVINSISQAVDNKWEVGDNGYYGMEAYIVRVYYREQVVWDVNGDDVINITDAVSLGITASLVEQNLNTYSLLTPAIIAVDETYGRWIEFGFSLNYITGAGSVSEGDILRINGIKDRWNNTARPGYSEIKLGGASGGYELQ
ncbi:MAG: IPT/TIG domain-containing protein [bacterium]